MDTESEMEKCHKAFDLLPLAVLATMRGECEKTIKLRRERAVTEGEKTKGVGKGGKGKRRN